METESNLEVCKSLINTYNAFWLDKFDTELKQACWDEATSPRSALTELMSNHKDQKNKPTQNIEGPFTVYWHSEYKKKIYIFEEGISIGTNNIINQEFINILLADPIAFIDLYIKESIIDKNELKKVITEPIKEPIKEGKHKLSKIHFTNNFVKPENDLFRFLNEIMQTFSLKNQEISDAPVRTENKKLGADTYHSETRSELTPTDVVGDKQQKSSYGTTQEHVNGNTNVTEDIVIQKFLEDHKSILEIFKEKDNSKFEDFWKSKIITDDLLKGVIKVKDLDLESEIKNFFTSEIVQNMLKLRSKFSHIAKSIHDPQKSYMDKKCMLIVAALQINQIISDFYIMADIFKTKTENDRPNQPYNIIIYLPNSVDVPKYQNFLKSLKFCRCS
jgi:hypothetical protein